MAGTFNTTYAYKQFSKAVHAASKDTMIVFDKMLEKMGKETVKKTKEYVMQLFYNSVPPSDAYNRLMDAGGFLDTISYNVYDHHLQIYCDWTRLHFGSDPGYMPHHINTSNGRAFTTGLYDYIMNGQWPGGKVSRPQHMVMSGGISEELSKEINEWLGNYATNALVNNLKAIGYDVDVIDTKLHKG